MISTFTVVIDANVFFGARLRSLFMELAQTGLFRARWTNDIHDEWMRAVAKRRGIPKADLIRIRDLMNEAVPDCLVKGYEGFIDTISLPDPNDRHVLAAAVVAKADAIITFNQSDFSLDELAKFGISTLHPDDFILDQIFLAEETIDAIRRDIAHYNDPPLAIADYIHSLELAGLLKTSELLKGIATLFEQDEV